MSSPTKAHREAALGLLYTHPVGSELKWLETGKEPEDSHAGIARAKRVAQALADTEASAYARGLADGAERERAAVVRSLDDRGYVMLAGDIRSSKHLEKSE